MEKDLDISGRKEHYYYKCPICNMSQHTETFLRFEFGEKDPFCLGFVQTRVNLGRYGFKRVSYKPLVDCIDDGGIGDEILERLRHSILAIIHSLHKKKLVKDVDLPLAMSSQKYSELAYHYEIARAKLQKAKQMISNLNYKIEVMGNQFTEINMEKETLQSQLNQVLVNNGGYVTY